MKKALISMKSVLFLMSSNLLMLSFSLARNIQRLHFRRKNIEYYLSGHSFSQKGTKLLQKAVST